jgi:acetyl esterase/lipase
MTERLAYGTDQFQFGELRLPSGDGPFPAAIVIHGGFWRSKYDLEYIQPVCDALANVGIASWNIEYRRIGNPGGGFPGTLDDVALAGDYFTSITSRFKLDSTRVIAIGHSAGGHLALWLASQKKILTGAISLAGVVDLRRGWELKLSNNIVGEFLGGSPDEVPERYASASPIERLPVGIPQRLFHGTADASVPLEISERYVQAARSRGDDATLIVLPDASHFDPVDPRTEQFAQVRACAMTLLKLQGGL